MAFSHFGNVDWVTLQDGHNHVARKSICCPWCFWMWDFNSVHFLEDWQTNPTKAEKSHFVQMSIIAQCFLRLSPFLNTTKMDVVFENLEQSKIVRKDISTKPTCLILYSNTATGLVHNLVFLPFHYLQMANFSFSTQVYNIMLLLHLLLEFCLYFPKA